MSCLRHEDVMGRGLAASQEQFTFCREPSLASPQVHHGVSSSRSRGWASSRPLLKLSEITAFRISLRNCASSKDLMSGTRIHEDVLRRGLLGNCSDALISMYAKCGALRTAKELLFTHKSRDVSVWTALIAGYIRQKNFHEALNCFEYMQLEGLCPSAVTYTCILKACGRLKLIEKGEQLHDDISRLGLLQTDVVLGTALIDMYSKCGALSKAKNVLEELPARDVVAWSALISGYAQHGHGEEALTCLERMKWEGLSPDSMTYACILKACSIVGTVEKGEEIHANLVKQGLLTIDTVLDTALVDMYAKCGSLPKAQRLHEELPYRDVVSWSALIAGYSQQGQGEKAFEGFLRMQHEGLSPNARTYACILNACGNLRAADEGKRIHEEIVRQGLLKNDVALGNALLDMYVKCGDLAKAQSVLEELPSKDAITWSTLIAEYVQQDQSEQALKCFDRMQMDGISPDATILSCILKACGMTRAEDKGRQIHETIAKGGFLGGNKLLGITLVDMYAKCGALAMAQSVFNKLPSRDVFSWNALIAGYAQKGLGEQAWKCFEQMQSEGLTPNAITFASILKACGGLKAIDKGTQIHNEIMKRELHENDSVLGNALVDMYAKCGVFAKAERVLKELHLQDVVSWNALIAGYIQEGLGEQALNCYVQLQQKGVSPNEATFICILKACGTLGSVEKGQQFHEEIDKQGLLRDNVVIGTALVDMYAKCGALDTAADVLEELPFRDAVTWNALIAGYARHGQGLEALNCLKRMQSEGFCPDAATFSSVLSACCHLGLLESCHAYLVEMSTKYGVKPHLEHYTLMVDVFGRAGQLGNAVKMIHEMPSSDYSVLWHALLGACQKWGDVKVGRWAFKQAMKVDKNDLTAYVLMSNVYTAAGMQEVTERVGIMNRTNAVN